MKSLRCRLGFHDEESYPPLKRKRKPNGRPYLYIWGRFCKRCGTLLREPFAPGGE